MKPSDVKPWFHEDIASVIRGLMASYTLGHPKESERDIFMSALAMFAATTGTELSDCFTAQDIEKIHRLVSGR